MKTTPILPTGSVVEPASKQTRSVEKDQEISVSKSLGTVARDAVIGAVIGGAGAALNIFYIIGIDPDKPVEQVLLNTAAGAVIGSAVGLISRQVASSLQT